MTYPAAISAGRRRRLVETGDDGSPLAVVITPARPCIRGRSPPRPSATCETRRHRSAPAKNRSPPTSPSPPTSSSRPFRPRPPGRTSLQPRLHQSCLHQSRFTHPRTARVPAARQRGHRAAHVPPLGGSSSSRDAAKKPMPSARAAARPEGRKDPRQTDGMNPPGYRRYSQIRGAPARARPREPSPTCGLHSSSMGPVQPSSSARKTAARSPAARRRRPPWKVYPLKSLPPGTLDVFDSRAFLGRIVAAGPGRRLGLGGSASPLSAPPSPLAIPRRTRRLSPRLLVSGRSPGSPRKGAIPVGSGMSSAVGPSSGPRGAPRLSRSGRGRTQGAAPRVGTEQLVQRSIRHRGFPVLLVVLSGVIHVLAAGFEARTFERWVEEDRPDQPQPREPLDGPRGVHRRSAPGLRRRPRRARSRRCAPRLRRAQAISDQTQRLALPQPSRPYSRPPAPPLARETAAPARKPSPNRAYLQLSRCSSRSADCDRAGLTAARKPGVFGDDCTPSRDDQPREAPRDARAPRAHLARAPSPAKWLFSLVRVDNFAPHKKISARP